MLLSLPRPNYDLISELDALFADFQLANKPPTLRREILEAEIRDGGVQLHIRQVPLSRIRLRLRLRIVPRHAK